MLKNVHLICLKVSTENNLRFICLNTWGSWSAFVYYYYIVCEGIFSAENGEN